MDPGSYAFFLKLSGEELELLKALDGNTTKFMASHEINS